MSLLSPELEAFVAVVKTSTVHGAAREIGLTQTGVTQRIRALEGKVRATLFTRSRKGMRLTEEGEALYLYCQKVLDIEGETLSQVVGNSTKKRVRIQIAGSSSIMRARIIPHTIKITDSFPELRFTYHFTDDESPIRYLKSGECQLAIMTPLEVANELDSKKLEPEIYIMVGPHSWKDRDIKDILKNERLVDFNYGDKVTLSFLKKYNLDHLANKDGHYVNNTDGLVSLLTMGYGYSVLSKRFIDPYIKSKQLAHLLPDKHSKMDFVLAWYPRKEMPKYFMKIIDHIN